MVWFQIHAGTADQLTCSIQSTTFHRAFPEWRCCVHGRWLVRRHASAFTGRDTRRRHRGGSPQLARPRVGPNRSRRDNERLTESRGDAGSCAGSNGYAGALNECAIRSKWKSGSILTVPVNQSRRSSCRGLRACSFDFHAFVSSLLVRFTTHKSFSCYLLLVELVQLPFTSGLYTFSSQS